LTAASAVLGTAVFAVAFGAGGYAVFGAVAAAVERS
jgi:hypothetical protein